MYLGGGFNLSGLIKKDGSDLIGLAIAYAKLEENKQNETAIEFTCHFPLNDYFYIHPDIQFIINPSGIDRNLPNSLAGIIRIGAQL